MDNYRIVLEVLGEVCGERVAPRAAEADEEGAHFENGEVTYAAATRDAIDALRQAELFGAMLSREYGGLNLPESVYQMMVEMVARAESGLMTVYGLQEIASLLEEYRRSGDQGARPAPLLARRGLRGDGPDRGRRRLGPGRRRDAGHPRRGHRPVAPQRRQALHHQRAGRRVAGPGPQRGGLHGRPRPLDVPGRARRHGQDPAHREQDGDPRVADVRDPVHATPRPS